MAGLLGVLITIYRRVNIGKAKAPFREKLLVHAPFSVYLGWITIATIANVSLALVSVNWDGFGINPQTWALIVLGVALIIAFAVIVTRRDIAYSLVIIWALAGIVIKQSMYGNIVTVAEIGIVLVLVVLALILIAYRLKFRSIIKK
jgi:hypothetical protein